MINYDSLDNLTQRHTIFIIYDDLYKSEKDIINNGHIGDSVYVGANPLNSSFLKYNLHSGVYFGELMSIIPQEGISISVRSNIPKSDNDILWIELSNIVQNRTIQ